MCCSASAETGPSSTRPGTPPLHDVPILGVNMGSVGFMAELEQGELQPAHPAGRRRSIRPRSRMMLDVRVLRGEKVLSEDLALNDAVISKGAVARVAEMEVSGGRGAGHQL